MIWLILFVCFCICSLIFFLCWWDVCVVISHRNHRRHLFFRRDKLISYNRLNEIKKRETQTHTQWERLNKINRQSWKWNEKKWVGHQQQQWQKRNKKRKMIIISAKLCEKWTELRLWNKCCWNASWQQPQLRNPKVTTTTTTSTTRWRMIIIDYIHYKWLKLFSFLYELLYYIYYFVWLLI